MATDNSTRPDPEPIPVVAEYFERPYGSGSVLDYLIALDGVCATLSAEQVNFDDHDQIERICGMSTAAHILARQLYGRYYASRKPPSKRQLERARKAQSEWTDAMREKLAGPAQEYLRAARAVEQTEGNA